MVDRVTEQYPAADDASIAAARAILTGASMARWLAPTAESRIERISVDAVVDRDWPVPDTDTAAVMALRQSVAGHGIVEPLLLSHAGSGRFELVTGSRRLRVARELGFATVPAIVRDIDDAAALVATLWSVAGRQRLDDTQSAALQDRLVAAGVSSTEAAALVAAAQPAAPKFVVTTARRPESQLHLALTDRPQTARFVVAMPPQPPVLPQAATMALVSVLRTLDPATVLRPE
jgi:ParB/RepB/Spo0J family partition protein